MRAVAVELLLEVLREPLEVGLQPCLDLVREVAAGRPWDFAAASSMACTRAVVSRVVGETAGSRST